MKYCAKCGKELHDEAVVCVGCGCATTPSATPKASRDPEHDRLMLFVSDANTINILGILSIVLCLGIGIIFQIFNMIKIKKYQIAGAKGKVTLTYPEFSLSNSGDIALYEAAKKKIKLANTLTSIGFGISLGLIFICFWFGLIMPLIY